MEHVFGDFSMLSESNLFAQFINIFCQCCKTELQLKSSCVVLLPKVSVIII